MKIIHHLFMFVLCAFICLATCSCKTSKVTEQRTSSSSASVACNHSETQSASEWASFLRLLTLDSLEVVYTPYVVDSSGFAPLSGTESLALPKSTQGGDFGSPSLSTAATTFRTPSLRDGFSTSTAVAPPYHPPAKAHIKAYGLHLSAGYKEQSAATLAAVDSVSKHTQSADKSKEVVKRTSPYIIYTAVAVIILIMALLAIIYFSRKRL